MATNYIGNNDFRGYLNYLGTQGDANAKNALNYAGNDGGINDNSIQSFYDSPTADRTGDLNAAKQYVASAYQNFINQGAVGGGGATQASANNPLFDQAIGNTQSAIDRLGSQYNSGASSIDSSAQNALNQLLLGRNQSQSAYDTTKQQSTQDYIGAKNTIGANAGSTLNGLRRLLGSKGAGGGSAYNIAAPEAVARGATQQRTDVGNTFGANNKALDTNWANYLTGYDNQVSSVGNQRDQQKQGLQQNIDNNRASLLQSLAQLTSQRDQANGGNGAAASQPYLDQANALLDRTANYQTAPINYQTQAYSGPDLSKYTTAKQTPTYQGQSQSNDYFSPYLQALLGKKQQTA